MVNKQQNLVTGITSTGELTIGNYIGAIKPTLNLVKKYNSFVFVADLHSLTIPYNVAELKERTFKTIAIYLACGLDPNDICIFQQSHVPEHTYLFYLLSCISSMGELNKMTQYKDKSIKFKQQNKTILVPTGIFLYPVLMAADIMLYNANVVPVGLDQKQHLELTVNLINRVNKKFNLNFNIPRPIIPKHGFKIMSLTDPLQKMSKSSDVEKSYIRLLDKKETIAKKIQHAVTDSENLVSYDPIKKPGISNLLTIYHGFSDATFEEIIKKFAGFQYGEFKKALIFLISEKLGAIQDKMLYYLNHKDIVYNILNQCVKEARIVAKTNLKLVLNAMGIGNHEKNARIKL